MAKKKKGDLKLIMPKHSASVDHFRLALKVCGAHPSGVEVDDFKDELFDELHAEHLEAVKNHDGSHYTKCLQLPRYFGMVRYCLSGERANALTKRGREMLLALSANPVDKSTVWRLLFEAICRNYFGRDNEGVGSYSYCEPMAIFFRAASDLSGITNSEYGYLIQELDEKGRPYRQILSEIENARRNGGVQNAPQSQASNLSDWKTILFLKNLEFVERDEATGRMGLARTLRDAYEGVLYKLPLYNRGFKRQLFMRWMEVRGLGQSVVNYSDSLGAMADPYGEKSSAQFDGFYEKLTGSMPRRNVYDLNSLAEYNLYYSALNEFWELPVEQAPGGFNEDAFFECFYYARGAKNIDNHRLMNACVQYKDFLNWWDENKKDFAVEDFNEMEMENTMVIGDLGPLQRISYGAPGTGKSHGVDDVAAKLPKEDVVRTTFHPDSDYSTFVGAYKPKMELVPRVAMDGTTVKKATYDAGIDADAKALLEVEKRISYEFVPQAFAKAYVRAWKRMATPGADGKIAPVMLVIEEINRGDCAKIFGDLFQLLDRRVKDDQQDATKRAGFSEYPVLADSDLADFIRRELTDDEKTAITNAGYGTVVASEHLELMLPPNMYIWATMNTSDQSLFPMDSAFKRRWDWKYTPIKDEGRNWKIQVGGSEYDWWKFLKKVNAEVLHLTSSEDKQLGYFFVKPTDDVIDAEMFVNKVMFFLWNVVFKDCYTECEYLKNADEHYTFKDFFKDDGTIDEATVKKVLDELFKDSKTGATA